MKQYSYITTGTCSKQILFELDDEHFIHNVQFIGGCAGNTVGVAHLVEGRKAEEVIQRLQGIPCHDRGTSCPDQLSRALRAAIAESSNNL